MTAKNKSVFSKPFLSHEKVHAVNHVIAQSTKKMVIELQKEHFIDGHRITLQPQMNFATPPTAFDNTKLIERFQVTLKNGDMVDLDGVEAIKALRFIGGADYEQVVLGKAAAANVVLDLHYTQQGALHDLITGLHANALDKLTLTITFTDSLGFVGGVPSVFTVASAAGVVPVVLAAPAANQTVAVDVDSLFYESYDNDPRVGLLLQKVKSQDYPRSGAGVKDPVLLESRGITRFLMLSCYTINADGSRTLNDGILQSVTLQRAFKKIRVYETFELKCDGKESGLLGDGIYVIDFGEDEEGWLDLRDDAAGKTVEGKLLIESTPGAPASWVIRVCQNQNVQLHSLV